MPDLKDIAKLNWRDFLTFDQELPAEHVEALDKYFSQFAAIPDFEKAECINCGARLDGFLGCFRWGLAHGEGFCGGCKWPARGYHYDVGPIKRLSYVLQYHPSLVKRRDAKEDSE